VPDDESDEQWSGEATDPEDPTVAHDDIMKRLLDYQRSLRGDEEEPLEIPDPAPEVAEVNEVAPEPEAVPPSLDEPVGQEFDFPGAQSAAVPSLDVEPAPETEPEPAVELPAVLEPVAGVDPAPPALGPLAGSREELEARVHRLEERLERLGARVVSLRRSFQEMAIAADDDLAAMKDEIDESRPDPDESDAPR
jgi:hypothetical protein